MCILVSHHEISFKMTAVLCSLLTTDDFSSLSPWLNACRVLAAVCCAPQFNYYLIDFSCISIFSSLSHSGCPVGVMFVFLPSKISLWNHLESKVFLFASPPPSCLHPSSGMSNCSSLEVGLCRQAIQEETSSLHRIFKRKQYSTAYLPTKGTWFLNGPSLVCIKDHA